MNKTDALRTEFQSETKKKWYSCPAYHGETVYASWEYQLWLEKRIIELSATQVKEILHSQDSSTPKEGEGWEELLTFIYGMKTWQTLNNGCDIETIHIPSLIHKIKELHPTK